MTGGGTTKAGAITKFQDIGVLPTVVGITNKETGKLAQKDTIGTEEDGNNF